jgi:hypothetical protein
MSARNQAKPGQVHTPRLHHKVGFGVVGTLVLFILVLLPFVLTSALSEIFLPPKLTTVSLTPPRTAAASTYARLQLDVISLDQWGGTVTLRASGVHICQPACDSSIRIAFIALPSSPDEQASPPSDSITLPPSAREVTQDIKLPIDGDPIRYPFDSYLVNVGMTAEQVSPDGTTHVATPAEVQGHYFATLTSRVPLVRARKSERIDPASLPPNPDGYQYAAGARIALTRPFYLQILTVLLVVLVASAAAFAVFMRPVNELVLSSGALILGVWGIRSVLLGSQVSGFTAVDLSLSVVILFMLSAIAVRAVLYLHSLAGHPLRQLVPARGPSEDSAAPARPPAENLPEDQP